MPLRSSSRPGVPAWRTLAAVLLVCAACVTARAQTKDEVTLNFVNSDIEAVATAIGQMTKRNFLIDPRVKGTINIISSRPVQSAAVYDIFLSALRMQGFAAVESGGVTKILLEADAKLHLGSVTEGRAPGGDRLLTQVFVLKYASANQLVSVLRPIISAANTIVAYPSNNSLIITDYAGNLRRIERIIDAIDRPSGSETVVIPLRFAAAADLAKTLANILGEGGAVPGAPAASGDASGRFVLTSDARTNSIIVRSENPERISRVQGLVRQLDVPTGAAGNIHVIYLKNAEATRVAQTLRSILAGETGAALAAPAPTMASAPAAQGTAQGIQQGGAAFSQALPASTGGHGIVADPASNAIIVSAPDAIMANIRAVV